MSDKITIFRILDTRTGHTVNRRYGGPALYTALSSAKGARTQMWSREALKIQALQASYIPEEDDCQLTWVDVTE